MPISLKSVVDGAKNFGIDVKQVFTGIDTSQFASVDLQESFFKELLDYALERGYLNEIPKMKNFIDNASYEKLQEFANKKTAWIKINRLPVNPSNSDDYDLLSRWQEALSALHAWKQKVIFILLRNDGESSLLIGTQSLDINVNSNQAATQLQQALSASMPGIDADILVGAEVNRHLSRVYSFQAAGAVTGIPSFRKNSDYDVLQTLDAIAFGIKSKQKSMVNGRIEEKIVEKDFALVIIAEAIEDSEIANSIADFRSMGNDIHTFVKKTVSDSENQGTSTNISANVGGLIGGILGGIGKVIPFMPRPGKRPPLIFMSKGFTRSTSHGINTEYLNNFAKYSEEVIEHHVERMKKGRNLGFWNVGIYPVADTKNDVGIIMGLLRTIYSGDESYIEPIRILDLNNNHGIQNGYSYKETVDLFTLVPIADENGIVQNNWNRFGKNYEYISTPLNTEELSLATSLPRKDVPGLRFVKNAVRFANNPAEVQGENKINLGNIIDTGIIQNATYGMDVHSLVRHALLCGTPGSGKSTTTRKIANCVMDKDIPVLVLEPAKDEYVRWAINYNKKIDADKSLSPNEKKKKKFRIFMPGVTSIDGYDLNELKINPFQPAAIKNARIDMLSRCEQLVTILNATLPTSDVLPTIIDEAVYTYLNNNYRKGFKDGDMEQEDSYVLFEGLLNTAKQIISQRGYEQKVQDNLSAAMETRFAYLIRGKRGKILNVDLSTDYDELFNHNVIINVSKIGGQKDKALIMSLIMLSLNEYKVSQYTYDVNYRNSASQNHLMHLAIIEEAHNLLTKPSVDSSNSGNASVIAAEMFSNMLAETRAYGQGIMIVDQIPTKIIPDAIKNTNYKIVHRLVSPDDAEIMANALALKGDQKDLIPSLAIGEAIIMGDMDDASAWVKIKNKF